MPNLNWDSRNAAVHAHTQTPYHLLQHAGNYGAPPAQGGQARSEVQNLLIQGDNLQALKALLPFYTGRVKCVFIDPPYNTGSAFDHYDDNLEHGIWLSTMYPRLKLLHQLLAKDGFIAVHLDDSEGHYMKVMLDEIFARSNYLVTIYPIVRYAEKTLKQDMDFHKRVEQVHIYRKSFDAKPNRPSNLISHEKYVYKIIETGTPEKLTLSGKAVEIFKKGDWRIEETQASVDSLKEIWATGTILDGNSSGRFFRDNLTGRATTDGLGALYKVVGIGDDVLPYRYFTGPQRIKATKGKYFQGVPLDKRDTSKNESTPIDNSYDFSADFGNCRTEGDADFRSGKKPENYLKLILETLTNPNDLVLDSFLGSGTTAAVAHKMGRRWIGIEMGPHAVTHCIPRLEKVIAGEQGGISSAVGWAGGGGFAHYTLGEPVFMANRHINPQVKFAALAAFVWHRETQQAANTTHTAPLLGVHEGTAYYLLYNGILRDRSVDGGNVLTRSLWDWLQSHHAPSELVGRCVVYGEICKLAAPLCAKLGIVFKQMPYRLQDA